MISALGFLIIVGVVETTGTRRHRGNIGNICKLFYNHISQYYVVALNTQTYKVFGNLIGVQHTIEIAKETIELPYSQLTTQNAKDLEGFGNLRGLAERLFSLYFIHY
jgi:hypothetical protein